MDGEPAFPAEVLGGDAGDWPVTIGVALPIPEPFLGELGAYRERFGDPLAHAIVAHITLVPPTQVADEDHLAAVLDHLREVASGLAPFPLVLAGAGTFRPVSRRFQVSLRLVGAESLVPPELVRCQYEDV